ncbi:hypothetical protein [Phorcysia thermohydrogeniphila]|uniref:Uncharacterized protein n=1 Tax=Phorcysia thermohydrogeniphila TaxID=936138 RepID=A0A4R1GB82_9BACT|nr:hypothetical protein [Phorcysia thermohydrogeniphila]TCK02899.1 hypothetical protein CLV27_1613 [Phorcysia thermohydrogeniphila]
MRKIGTLVILLLLSVSCGSEKVEETAGTAYATVKFDLEERVAEALKYLESLKGLKESKKFVDAVDTLEGFLKGTHSDVGATLRALSYLERHSKFIPQEKLIQLKQLVELLVSYRQPVVG